MKNRHIYFGLTIAMIVASITSGTTQLTYQLAVDDPFSNVSIGHFASPALGDLDGDGDVDMIIGQYNSNDMLYYRNVGDPANPLFEEQTGDENPFSVYWNNSGCNAPALVDIDADGDLDLFSGVWVNIIRYFRNDGDSIVPDYIYQDGGNNPLDTVFTEGICSYPAFVDIDDDEDYDVFVTDGNGNIEFYRNTGTKFSPEFVRDSTDNPLSDLSLTARTKITFEDINEDGLIDAVIGHDLSEPEILYFENTGTVNQAAFEPRTGLENPFRDIEGVFALVPAFEDIDDDGKDELIVGTMGDVRLYEATFLSSTGDQKNIDIEIYPNPSSDLLQVSGVDLIQIELYTIQGILMKSINPGSTITNIDVRDITSGTYLIKAISSEGGSSVSTVVVQ